jgi:EAL domain-containing protein (putative c-di-GMP-specific phosphodiesterase class I)/GGDEF domain-containing protein/integral membrane sensor domain MASE1
MRLTATVGYLSLSTVLYHVVDHRAASDAGMFFPPAGLAFGFLVLFGRRGIPIVIIAQVLGCLVTSPDKLIVDPGWEALRLVAVTLVYAAGAVLLRRRWREPERIATLAWFVIIALIVVPLAAVATEVLVEKLAGADLDVAVWAQAVVGTAAAIATLTPGVLQPARAMLMRQIVPVLPPPGARADVVAQALALIVAPAGLILLPSAAPAELPMLAIAAVPLVWTAARPDRLWSSVVLAVCSLALGVAVSAQYGASEEMFRAQVLMITGALAALFVGTSLFGAAEEQRHADLTASRWRALVDASPVVVARVARDGAWRLETEGRQGDASTVVASACAVREIEAAISVGRQQSVHWDIPATCDSPVRHFVTQVSPLPDGEALTVTRETTRVEGAEAALAWERTHDRDSGLPNRDLLLATATRAVAEDVPTSLVVIDVDPLSRKASVVGADPAEVLGVLVRRLEVALDLEAGGEEEQLLARVGEDQVGVLLPVDAAVATRRTHRLLSALAVSVPAGDRRLPVTASAGVAAVEAGQPAREALRRAMIAAQAARESGRREVVVFDNLAITTTAERARLAGDVLAASERGELEVVFQPDVDLADGRVTGVEALVRWRRPGGLVAATDLFVQLAEESGAVQAIDAWVMEESLRHLRTWREDHGLDGLELGLNVSALSLVPDLPERVADACARYGVPPDRVRLEVTETALGDEGDAYRVLERARAIGCRVALDDFGTGYASLSRLHRLPIDLLKLDRSFLSGLIDDVAGRALVSLVLGLAGPLELEVLAEGVETEPQRDLLVELGCRRAQGFLFARPAPPPMLLRRLLNRHSLGRLNSFAV